MIYYTELQSAKMMQKLLPLDDLERCASRFKYPARLNFDTETKKTYWGPDGHEVSFKTFRRIVKNKKSFLAHFPLWVQSYFGERSINKLKKKAIREGHCKPDESNAVNYPKKGAQVV